MSHRKIKINKTVPEKKNEENLGFIERIYIFFGEKIGISSFCVCMLLFKAIEVAFRTEKGKKGLFMVHLYCNRMCTSPNPLQNRNWGQLFSPKL